MSSGVSAKFQPLRCEILCKHIQRQMLRQVLQEKHAELSREAEVTKDPLPPFHCLELLLFLDTNILFARPYWISAWWDATWTSFRTWDWIDRIWFWTDFHIFKFKSLQHNLAIFLLLSLNNPKACAWTTLFTLDIKTDSDTITYT